MNCNCKDKIRKELPHISPSGGYDEVDEVLGLLRVARMREDTAEKSYERLKQLIGTPPEGAHPDEWKPRAGTWHQERLNWQHEVETLRAHIQKVAPGYTITPL